MDYMLKSSDERVVINDFVQGDPLSEENLDKTLELVSNLRKVDSANHCKMGVSEVENPDRIRLSLPNKTIWIYTGYTWENIMKYEYGAKYINNFNTDALRQCVVSKCDVLVDGRYIDSQRNPSKKWVGSDNQRVISITESLKQGKVITLE